MTEASTTLTYGQFKDNKAFEKQRATHYGDLRAPWCEIITKVAIAVIAALVATAGAYIIHLGGAGIATLFWAGVGVSSLGGATFLITMALLISQSFRSYRDHKNQEKTVDSKPLTNEQLREVLAADDEKQENRVDAVKKLSQGEFVVNLTELDNACFADEAHVLTPGEEALLSAYAQEDKLKVLTQEQVDELSQQCCIQLLKDIPADHGFAELKENETTIVEKLVGRLTDDQKRDNINLFTKHTQTIARGDTFKNLVPLFLDKCKNRGANDPLPGAEHFVFLKHFPDKVREWFKDQEAAGWFTTNVDISQSVAVGTLNNMGDALPALLDALKPDEAVYTHVITAFATQWKLTFNDADPKALPAAVNNHEIFTRLVTEEVLFHAIFSKDTFKDDAEFMYALLNHEKATPSTALARFSGERLGDLYTKLEEKAETGSNLQSPEKNPLGDNAQVVALAQALAEKLHECQNVTWENIPLRARGAYLQYVKVPDGENQAFAIMQSLGKDGIKTFLPHVARIPNAFHRLEEAMRQEIVNEWLGAFTINVTKEDPVFALVATELDLGKAILNDKQEHSIAKRTHLADGLLGAMKGDEATLKAFIGWLHENTEEVVNSFFGSVANNPNGFKEMVALHKRAETWMPFALDAIGAKDKGAEGLIAALEEDDFEQLTLHLRDRLANFLTIATTLERKLCGPFGKDQRFTAVQQKHTDEGYWTSFNEAMSEDS